MWAACDWPHLVYSPSSLRKAILEAGSERTRRAPPSRKIRGSFPGGRVSGTVKKLQEAGSVLLRLFRVFRFYELLCGFQNPDSTLPSVDEVDHREPLAASAPAPQAQVRAPSRRGTTLVNC